MFLNSCRSLDSNLNVFIIQMGLSHRGPHADNVYLLRGLKHACLRTPDPSWQTFTSRCQVIKAKSKVSAELWQQALLWLRAPASVILGVAVAPELCFIPFSRFIARFYLSVSTCVGG